MPRKIISVEYQIPGFSDAHFTYSSEQSLLDADVIVFKPMQLSDGTEKPSFTESGSFQLQQSAEHWKRELSIALEYGKTIFLILGKYQIGSVDTGKKEIKGRTTINYVRDYSNYEFLPARLPSMTAKSGTEIAFTGDPTFAIFWKELKPHLEYECYFNEKVKRPVFTTKTGERPIGAVFNIGKGHLVTLPSIGYDEDSFLKERKGDFYWTKEAIKFGKGVASILLDIDKSLRSESMATPPPGWIENPDFLSPQETKLLKNIADANDQIQKIRSEEQSLQTDLNRERQPKNLLFETGKPLEAAVMNALKTLGYSAENYNDGELELDHVIVSPEGDRFIGECEGKDSSAINIDKFRQLSENIQADLQRENVDKPAIGILFGNGFRLAAPQDRQDQFTQKCLSSAKRGTILVRTMDLYPVVRYIRETNDQGYMRSCRDAILASLGRIVDFPAPPIR
jgi:hypothetical protein